MQLLLLASVSRATPDVGAILRPEAVVDLAGDRIGEDPAALHTWIRAFAGDETDRGDAWFLEARLQHHALFGGDVEAWYELGLGETGFDGRLGGPSSPVRLRIGALRERWGRLDLLPVLDVLNPIDARIGPLVPSQWQRIPIPMAVAQIGSDKIRSETVLIPFAGADRLWLRETDWSLVRQGMTASFWNQAAGWEGDDQTEWINLTQQLAINSLDLDPSYRRGQDAATNGNSLPQALLVNGEIAQRFELYGPQFDVAVVAGLLRSSFPQAQLDDGLRQYLVTQTHPGVVELVNGELQTADGALTYAWPRTFLTGLEASTLIGGLQVRGEGSYTSDQVVRMDYIRSTTVPQIAAGVGIDYVRGSSLQITLESRWQHLLEVPVAPLVLAKADQIQIAAGLRAGLMAERLTLQLGGAYDLSFSELLLRPSLAYRATDQLQLELGAILLEGFATDAPRTLIDAITYQGGPVSFWSQNDSLTFAVSWIL
ncbi:MAG TPA: hypothetical protein ENK18_25455 [Deltaproteobacteria bacterium]|nr:hypothetical protein [Deltaproteobacteria bacterium]